MLEGQRAGAGLFTRGPWGAKAVSVEEEALSLDDIEHRILRPICLYHYRMGGH